MRRRLTLLLTLPLVFVALMITVASAQTPAPPAAKAIDISGKWAMVLQLSIGTSNPTLVLKQDGDKITGTYTGRYPEAKLTGKIGADRQLQFTVALDAEGQSVTMYFTGEVAADGKTIVKGVCNVEGLGEGSWEAKRAS